LELRFANFSELSRRPTGSDRCNTRFIKKYCKAFPKLVAWACFSWKGRGSLEWLEKVEMMNGVRYRRIPGREAEFFHAAAWSNLLSAG
jgi:hypothetical protein